MNTNNDNHESTTPVDYTRSNPYLIHESNIPPPPPPEYYMHQRTGRVWKVFIPFVLLLFGLVLGVLVYPTINELYHHSVAANPTPFVPFANPASQTQTPTPTPQAQITPTPTTNAAATVHKLSGLHSQDFKSFYKAFTQDIYSGKFDELGSSVVDTSSFQLSCDNSPSPPCTYAWISVDNMLHGRHLIFSSASGGPGPSSYDVTYINDSCKHIPYPVRAYTYTMVHYDQDGLLNAPKVGDAVLAFVDTAINSNTDQWIWEEVILQGSC